MKNQITHSKQKFDVEFAANHVITSNDSTFSQNSSYICSRARFFVL